MTCKLGHQYSNQNPFPCPFVHHVKFGGKELQWISWKVNLMFQYWFLGFNVRQLLNASSSEVYQKYLFPVMEFAVFRKMIHVNPFLPDFIENSNIFVIWLKCQNSLIFTDLSLTLRKKKSAFFPELHEPCSQTDWGPITMAALMKTKSFSTFVWKNKSDVKTMKYPELPRSVYGTK